MLKSKHERQERKRQEEEQKRKEEEKRKEQLRIQQQKEMMLQKDLSLQKQKKIKDDLYWEWFDWIERMKYGNQSERNTLYFNIQTKIENEKNELERYLKNVENMVQHKQYPESDWRKCLQNMTNLIGIEQMKTIYEECRRNFKKENCIEFFRKYIPIIRETLNVIVDRNKPLKLCALFRTVQTSLIINRSQQYASVISSSYFIKEKQYEQKSSGDNSTKMNVDKDEYEGYKIFFEEVMNITNMNGIEYINNSEKMQLLARQLFNSKDEYWSNYSSQSTSLTSSTRSNHSNDSCNSYNSYNSYNSNQFFVSHKSKNITIPKQSYEMKELKEQRETNSCSIIRISGPIDIIDNYELNDNQNKYSQSLNNINHLDNRDYRINSNYLDDQNEDNLIYENTCLQIEFMSEKLIEYHEILREKNREFQQKEIEYQKERERLNEYHENRHEKDIKEIIQLQNETNKMKQLLVSHFKMVQNIHEHYYQLLLKSKMNDYPYIVSHKFIRDKNIHCFTIDFNQLGDGESIIYLPMFEMIEGIGKCEMVDVDFDLQSSNNDKNKVNDECVGYFNNQGSTLLIGSFYDEENSTNKRYDVKILKGESQQSIENNEKESNMKEVPQENITEENNKIIQQPQQHEINVPLKDIMTGIQYRCEIEGIQYTLDIPPGTHENTEYQINEYHTVIIKYEQDNTYLRHENDLHAYFEYSRQYENQYVQIPYIDGTKLEGCSIQLVDNYHGSINNLGFVDPMTCQRGKYIIHISLK